MSLHIHRPSLNSITLKASAFAALCCTVGALHAQTSVLLPVERDVEIGYHDNYPTENTNYNWSPHLAAASTAGTMGGLNHGRGLLAFDLSVVPADSPILGAFMNLTAKGPFGPSAVGLIGNTGQNSSTLRRVTESWNDAPYLSQVFRACGHFALAGGPLVTWPFNLGHSSALVASL